MWKQKKDCCDIKDNELLYIHKKLFLTWFHLAALKKKPQLYHDTILENI